MATIVELLHEGDWACAYDEPERLVDACRALAPLVEPAEAELLARAVDSATSDFDESRHIWGAVAARIRARIKALPRWDDDPLC